MRRFGSSTRAHESKKTRRVTRGWLAALGSLSFACAFLESCILFEESCRIQEGDCRDLGGICVDHLGRSTCVFEDERCPIGKDAVCVNGDVFPCLGDRVSRSGRLCETYPDTVCHEVTRDGQETAVCALEPIPCPDGKQVGFCQGDTAVSCHSGFPVLTQDCASRGRVCIDGNSGAACAEPVCVGLEPYQTACWEGGVIRCSQGSPFPTPCESETSCFQTPFGALCIPKGEPPQLDWKRIEGGTFDYWTGDSYPGDREKTESVTLSDFDVLATEVSIAQFLQCTAAGACSSEHPNPRGVTPEHQGNFPARVSGVEARAFCQFVGGDLPSKEEWQYLVRSGGTELPFPWGTDAPSCSSTVIARGEQAPLDFGCGAGMPQPSCSHPDDVTPRGVCDLVGNVPEFTNLLNEEGFVLRGFGYTTTPEQARLGDMAPSGQGEFGFRCVRRP